MDYGAVVAPKFWLEFFLVQRFVKPKGNVHMRFNLVMTNVDMTRGKVLSNIGYCVSNQLIH